MKPDRLTLITYPYIVAGRYENLNKVPRNRCAIRFECGRKSDSRNRTWFVDLDEQLYELKKKVTTKERRILRNRRDHMMDHLASYVEAQLMDLTNIRYHVMTPAGIT